MAWPLIALLLLLPLSAIASPSPLVFEPGELDLGTAREGKEATAWLRIRNTGSRLEQIVELRASCGCTAVEPEARVLMPGAFTRVRVRIDTFAKQREVRKWIELVDGRGRTSRAWLRLRVVPAAHAMAGRSIFDGDCRRCHYDPALGKRDGAAIYRAVCAMCHGGDARGSYAPALAGRNRQVLMAVIAEGIGRPQMPGFARRHGGPLDARQIRALADWLAALDGASGGRYKSDPHQEEKIQ